MKYRLFNPRFNVESDRIVSKEDMHNPTLNSMFTNLKWKDDECEPVTISVKLVKETINRSTHVMDLSMPNLSSSILRSKREI